MGSIIYERKTLYERVWSKPLRTIAQEDGISGPGLAKICKKLDVPRPPRGYWAKVEAGHKVRKTPLPRLKKETPQTHCFFKREPDPAEALARDALMNDVSALPAASLAETLDNPHPLLRSYLRSLRAKNPKSPKQMKILDVQVQTAELRERAFLIMDAVLRTLDGHGVEVEVTPPSDENPYRNPSQTRAKIFNVEVAFGLDELYDVETTFEQTAIRERVGIAPRRVQVRVPNGKLALQIRTDVYSRSALRRSWRDGKKQRLEDCIEGFVEGLFQIAGQMRVREDEREQRRLEQKRAEEQRRLRARRMEQQRVMEQDLERRLALLRKAKEIRTFLDVVSERGEPVSDEEAQWRSWAEGHAQSLEDSILSPPFPTYD